LVAGAFKTLAKKKLALTTTNIFRRDQLELENDLLQGRRQTVLSTEAREED
jgi:hypothetical protein